MNSMMGGHTLIAYLGLPSAAAYIRDGRVRALAVTSRKRSPAVPDVPTVAEAGVPEQETVFFQGILVPAGTPREIVDRWHAEVVRIVALPDVKERLTAASYELEPNTPEQFAALIRTEVDKWAKVIRDAKIARIEWDLRGRNRAAHARLARVVDGGKPPARDSHHRRGPDRRIRLSQRAGADHRQRRARRRRRHRHPHRGAAARRAHGAAIRGGESRQRLGQCRRRGGVSRRARRLHAALFLRIAARDQRMDLQEAQLRSGRLRADRDHVAYSQRAGGAQRFPRRHGEGLHRLLEAPSSKGKLTAA